MFKTIAFALGELLESQVTQLSDHDLIRVGRPDSELTT